MPVLEVKELNKSFGAVKVLKGIDFSLEKGEILSIIGSSGSGKTTLLRCLNFLETPDLGSITVNGKVVFDAESNKKLNAAQKRERQLKFGMVFQNFNLFPHFKIKKNLTLVPMLRAKKGESNETVEQIEEKAEKLLSMIALSDKADCYPSQLSGGQQQRVAIARALMLDPEILCFDEPTSALDPELTGEVLRVIRSLRDAGHTMIIVTHEMEFARNISDKVIFMADGVIEEQGSTEEVFGNPRSEETRVFLSHVNMEI